MSYHHHHHHHRKDDEKREKIMENVRDAATIISLTCSVVGLALNSMKLVELGNKMSRR